MERLIQITRLSRTIAAALLLGFFSFLASVHEANALESAGSVAVGAYPNSVRSTDGRYLYAVTYGMPSKIVTVRLSDFSVINTYTTSLNRVRGAAVGPSIASDAAGVTEGIVLASDETPSKVVRVRVGAGGIPSSESSPYILSGSEGNASSVALDASGENAIIGSTDTKLLRLQLSDMSRLNFSQYSGGASVLRRVIQPSDRSFAYFSSYGGSSGIILKVRTSDMAVVSDSGAPPLYASGISADGVYGIFATVGVPSTVFRLRLSDFSLEGSYMLSYALQNVHSIAVSADGSYAYVGSHTRPSRLEEVRMSDGEQSNVIEIGSCCLISAVTDASQDFAYFGTGEGGTDSLVKIPLKQAPTNTYLPPQIPSGSWNVGSSLTALPGTWSATPLPSFAYAWERSSDGSTNWTAINNATSATYTFTAYDTAEFVRVRVVVANPFGSALATSAATGPIQGAPASLTAPSLSGIPDRGEVVSSTSGTWKAYPTPSIAYTWQRSDNGTTGWSDISGASGPTFTLRSEDAGYFVRSVSRATNWMGYADASAASIRVTGPPSNVVGPSVVGEGVAGSALTAVRGTWRAWPDPTYSYQWQRSGDGGSWTNISSATAASYTPTSPDVGAFIRVAVSARNTYGSAYSVSAATAPIISDGSSPTPPPAPNPPPVDACALTPPPPSGPLGISINDGAQFTNQRQVTISMVWPSCRERALISNDGGFRGAEERTLDSSGRAAWLLASIGAERLPKTVYARFREPTSRGSQESSTFTDDIVLDETPPVIASAGIAALARISSAAKARTYRIKVRASDKTSGVASAQFATDKSKKKLSKTQKYLSAMSFKSTLKPRWVRVQDRAGNFSKWSKLP
jgi:hypothetical protein